MSIEQKWSEMQKTVYLSYIVIAFMLLGSYIYIFFSFSQVELYPAFFLPVVIYLLLEKYRAKKYEKNAIYVFLGASIITFFWMHEVIKNNFLILLCFLVYLYIMIPLFIEYKKEKNSKAKLLSMAKIIVFLALFVFFFT